MDGFSIFDGYISIIDMDAVFNSSGLPIEVETDFLDVDSGGDDGSSGGGGTPVEGGGGALNIGSKKAITYSFEYCLMYVWRVVNPSRFKYWSQDFSSDTISLHSQMFVYEGDRTPQSDLMPAQAYYSPDSFDHIDSRDFAQYISDGTLYVVNVPLFPTGKPEYFMDKFEMEVFRYTKTNVPFEDWWIEDEFMKILIPAEALMADSYAYFINLKLKEGVSLPSDMDSSLTELRVTLEVLPDEIYDLIFNELRLPSYVIPVAATARGLEIDKTELWTVFD